MNEIKKTHWRIHDYRYESLKHILSGLNNTIDSLKLRVAEKGWYDGYWLLEESEPIFGIAFIAFQNYINGSIKDLVGDTGNKTDYYKIGDSFINTSYTRVELIVTLANYSKHKEDGIPHKATMAVLDAFELDYKIDQDAASIQDHIIFKTLDLFDKDWDLLKIMNMVTDWRKDLFELTCDN